jgi:hypothetical protein
VKTRRQPDAAALTAYLEGEVTASERASLEGELRDSAELRRTLEQLRNVSTLLGAPAGELESIDLAARVRAAVRRPSRPERARPRRWSMVWLGGLAACIAGALVIAGGPRTLTEFHQKSNGEPPFGGSRWAGIQIYRVAPNATPERLGARIAVGEGLLFGYTNLGAQPFDFLMIFAIDAKNQVRWFYPAYETLGTNPASISIERGRANVPLGELVQHDFAEGPLTVYALFTPRPSSVLEIENWVKQHGRPSGESPVPGGTLQRIEARVSR